MLKWVTDSKSCVISYNKFGCVCLDFNLLNNKYSCKANINTFNLASNITWKFTHSYLTYFLEDPELGRVQTNVSSSFSGDQQLTLEKKLLLKNMPLVFQENKIWPDLFGSVGLERFRRGWVTTLSQKVAFHQLTWSWLSFW